MVAPPNHGNAATLSLDSLLRILIVSPVRLLRDGLATMVKRRANVQSVAVAESTEAAITVLERFRPTFILLDVATEDGLSAARQLVASARAVRILGFAARALDHDIVAYASAGISGFVPREASAQDLFDAIDRTAKGELLCSPRIAATMFKRLVVLSKAPTKSNAGSPQLTEREAEIVRLIEDIYAARSSSFSLSHSENSRWTSALAGHDNSNNTATYLNTGTSTTTWPGDRYKSDPIGAAPSTQWFCHHTPTKRSSQCGEGRP